MRKLTRYERAITGIDPSAMAELDKALRSTQEARTVEIGGKFYTPAEAAEINAVIAKLDALMHQRQVRTMTVEWSAADQCGCFICERTRALASEACELMDAAGYVGGGYDPRNHVGARL